jgi:C-terminal processing protease CtpA/Prc
MRRYLLIAAAVACSSPASPVPTTTPAPPPASIVAASAPSLAQTGMAASRAELESDLAFEGPIEHWKTGSDATIESSNVHAGHGALRIERTTAAPTPFSAITKHADIDFAGSTVELRGYLRTEDVHGGAGLWLREDGDGSSVQFVNSLDPGLQGTTEWTEVSIKLPLDPAAKKLAWGVLLQGDGKAWADDLKLLVDGKPAWDAPYREREQTALDRDHEFDHGSGVTIAKLTSQQIENLTELGKVWGFLKYHHPKITSGQVHWDYELLRVLPTMLAANDRAAAEAAMLKWIDALGPVPACVRCATLDEKDLAVRPDLRWLDDRAQVGADLSARLHAVYAARVPDQQFYVAMAPGVGNPVLNHEPAYASVALPDSGFQLLALYRLWSIIEYWAPDRALAENWQDSLAKLIPTVTLATTAKDYKLSLIAAIATVHDTHANLWSSLDVRPPEGACEIPAVLRFVGQQPAVVTAERDTKLLAGDVITSIDGAAIADLLARWTPYYAASNDAARLRDVAGHMTRGPCADASLTVERRGKSLSLTVKRSVPVSRKRAFHDLPGPAFRLLSPDVAYLKLSDVKAADAAQYVKQAAGTKGWIIDIRNYPGQFVPFAIGSLLVDAPTPFVRFTGGDLSNPGAFYWSDPIVIEPAEPHYGGKVVVLVDEVSQSQAEYTAMAFRAAPRTVIVGSTTAGADGNVTDVPLPGGLSTMFSGLGVFYPDKRPTQVVGIVPDVRVTPTIAGLRAGRDEVLEAGLREILGKRASAAQLQKIVKTARATQ